MLAGIILLYFFCKLLFYYCHTKKTYDEAIEVIPEAAFPSYTGMGCVVTAGEGADNKRVYNFFIQ